jgi:hypothetical protein
MVGILAARGDPIEELYQCPSCHRVAEDLKCTDDLPMLQSGNELVKLPRFCCAICASEAHRIGLAAQKEAALAQLPPWETDAGTLVKLERDRLINASLWTDAPGSPLTAECQLNWTAWRARMHRLTVDFANPGDVVMPEQPALEYGE